MDEINNVPANLSATEDSTTLNNLDASNIEASDGIWNTGDHLDEINRDRDNRDPSRMAMWGNDIANIYDKDKFYALDNLDHSSLPNLISSLEKELAKHDFVMGDFVRRKKELDELREHTRPGKYMRGRNIPKYDKYGTEHKNHFDELSTSIDTHRSNYNETYRTMREMLSKSKLAYIENMTNIETNKKKYEVEDEAMKRIGLNNKFYMLRNGVLGNLASGSFSFGGAGGVNAANLASIDKLAHEKKKHADEQKNKSKQFALQTTLGVLKFVSDMTKALAPGKK